MTESQLIAKPPSELRQRIGQWSAVRQQTLRDKQTCERNIEQIDQYLKIADGVTVALQKLSDQLFQETLKTIEDKLTIALQEILEQPIRFKAEASWKNNAAAVEFYIERDGHREDILKGQGGSVANILSIGLRMFALATLSTENHRRFLILDEQDCWLRPELVPRLVKIAREAGEALGFQVLMISHHDRRVFEQHADRIYQLHSGINGVAKVSKLDATTA